MAKSKRRIVRFVIFFAIMVLLAFIALLPFYYSLLVSFRARTDIYKLPVNWLPVNPTLENYKMVFSESKLLLSFWNTFYLTAINIATNLFFGALAGYGFAKFKFRGSRLIFRIMMFSMMIPGVATLVPSFLIIRSFPLMGGNNILGQGGRGLLGSPLGVLLPGTVGFYCVFFLRQFFLPVSNEYAEAARIDGAGEFRIFSTIYIPMIVPALLTLMIFCFQGSWNSYLWPSIILAGKENSYVLTMALREFSMKTNYQLGPMMAISILMTIPVIIVFCFAQKYFMSGIELGGVKG